MVILTGARQTILPPKIMYSLNSLFMGYELYCPAHSKFEVVFSYHRDLVALFASTRLADDGTELGNVGIG